MTKQELINDIVSKIEYLTKNNEIIWKEWRISVSPYCGYLSNYKDYELIIFTPLSELQIKHKTDKSIDYKIQNRVKKIIDMIVLKQEDALILKKINDDLTKA